MSHAIIETGSKQYRVQKGLVIDIEKIIGEPGASLTFDRVLQVSFNDSVHIGQPTVADAQVIGEIVKQKRDDKVMIMKLRRRKNSRRRAGHRQYLSVVKIVDILVQGVSIYGN